MNSLIKSNKKISKSQINFFSYLYGEKNAFFSRFLQFCTRRGKKFQAELILAKSLEIFQKEIQKNIHPKEKNPGDFKSFQAGVYEIDGAGSAALFHLSRFFQESIQNLQPLFEVKKVRVAGSTYLVPSLISEKRQQNFAMNWLLESAQERKKKTPDLRFEECLALEIFQAYMKQGQARQKRNELHKLAEANRAFSHFRWW